jgi:alpha-amylase
LVIAYLLEGLPQDESLHFGVEFNFAGLPADADDRFFHDLDGQRLGHLGTELDLNELSGLGLTDQWQGIDLQLCCDRPTRFWTFPVATVSQSEGGFELVHQSAVVLPHWLVTGDANGSWSTTLRLTVDTAMATNRAEQHEVVAAT